MVKSSVKPRHRLKMDSTMQEATEICDNLSDYPEVEEDVQSFVNAFLLKQTLLKSFLTAIAALFMGAIADRLGFRYCTTISIFGMTPLGDWQN